MSEPTESRVPFELHVWSDVVDRESGKVRGPLAAIIAVSEWAEAGHCDAWHIALLIALIRSVDWRTGKSKPPKCPSVETLATRSGMSRRKAFVVLADLVNWGVVDVTERTIGKGARVANAYTIWVPVVLGSSVAPSRHGIAPPSAS